MTVDEELRPLGASRPVEVVHRAPGPVARAEPEAPPDPPPLSLQEEVLAVRDIVARLRGAWPMVAEPVVEATVRSAYESFRRARVRAYVPILVERRARRVLGAAARDSSPGETPDSSRHAAGHATPE
ncbi:three-helix bundle dimerization domain-containing protein [Streptomyces sp. NPDC005538]|uniref:three-helix bundle dimerization domain-containing protein n=1 Tax=unclassified Streptomyces TaxID=2593676 RepID=UPI0033BDD853